MFSGSWDFSSLLGGIGAGDAPGDAGDGGGPVGAGDVAEYSVMGSVSSLSASPYGFFGSYASGGSGALPLYASGGGYSGGGYDAPVPYGLYGGAAGGGYDAPVPYGLYGGAAGGGPGAPPHHVSPVGTPEDAEKVLKENLVLAVNFAGACSFLWEKYDVNVKAYWDSVKAEFPEGFPSLSTIKEVPVITLMALEVTAETFPDVQLTDEMAEICGDNLSYVYPPWDPPAPFNFKGMTYGQLVNFTHYHKIGVKCVNDLGSRMVVD